MIDLSQKRILLIDDNATIHEDFRKILFSTKHDAIPDPLEAIVFDQTSESCPDYLGSMNFHMDSAYQGKEATELVEKAVSSEQPYALAFVDIRMPPGWDGIDTIKHIWEIDPDMQIVICTAYADYSWEEMVHKLQGTDNFLILKKPFDSIEVRQLAAALTKKWELNRRVKHKIENLEMTVQERTAELSRAKEKAEAANRLKTEFLRNMSHELRVPLTSIIGFAELIHSGTVETQNYKEYCKDILSSSQHLSQMISDLLDVSRFESGKMELFPEPVDLHKLIDEIKEMYRLAISEKQMQFDINVDPKLTNIVVDPFRLKQILYHYISNAIKFTPNKGKIKLRIFPVNNDQFRIEVSDTGIGIQEEDLNKLFVALQQLDSSMSKRYSGIGLGLALVRRIVESQGGKYGVESTFGKGSSFFATLPSRPPSDS